MKAFWLLILKHQADGQDPAGTLSRARGAGRRLLPAGRCHFWHSLSIMLDHVFKDSQLVHLRQCCRLWDPVLRPPWKCQGFHLVHGEGKERRGERREERRRGEEGRRRGEDMNERMEGAMLGTW